MDWNNYIQMILDWIEEDTSGSLTLEQVSQRLGFSPYYCTRKFHKLTGKTMRQYVTLRRISRVAVEVKNTDQRILDIAIKYGFSSHEALTRAFVSCFGLTPQEYRKSFISIPLLLPKKIVFPSNKENQEFQKMDLQKKEIAEVSEECFPKLYFIGIRDPKANGYWELWEKRSDCDEITGHLESIIEEHNLSAASFQIGGWLNGMGKQGYLYGILVPSDYSGPIPPACEKVLIPEGNYLKFHHPIYNYVKQEEQVTEILNKSIRNYDFEKNENKIASSHRPTWHYHLPEEYGQAILIPVESK